MQLTRISNEEEPEPAWYALSLTAPGKLEMFLRKKPKERFALLIILAMW